MSDKAVATPADEPNGNFVEEQSPVKANSWKGLFETEREHEGHEKANDGVQANSGIRVSLTTSWDHKESRSEMDEEKATDPCGRGITPQNEDPFYPPGFEPQRNLEPKETDAPQELTQKGEKRINIEAKMTSGNNEKMRVTRSVSKGAQLLEMEAMKKIEAEEAWLLGKKLGLHADNEDAVIKELMKDDTAQENVKQRKRGRPRKSKS